MPRRKRSAQGRLGFSRRAPRVLLGYRRMLVPVADNPESEQAMDVASRLAAEHGASIIAVAVIEVPALLPLDAHMIEEEREAHRLLERATARAELYGISTSTRTLRARDAASAIVDQATANETETILIGAPRKERASRGLALFGSTVEHVMKKAPCRVLLIGTPVPANARRRSPA